MVGPRAAFYKDWQNLLKTEKGRKKESLKEKISSEGKEVEVKKEDSFVANDEYIETKKRLFLAVRPLAISLAAPIPRTRCLFIAPSRGIRSSM